MKTILKPNQTTMIRTITALALLAVATSTANLPLAVACVAGGLGIAATLPPDRV